MPEGHSVHRIARQFGANFVGTAPEVSSPQGRFAQGAEITQALGRARYAGLPGRTLAVEEGREIQLGFAIHGTSLPLLPACSPPHFATTANAWRIPIDATPRVLTCAIPLRSRLDEYPSLQWH